MWFLTVGIYICVLICLIVFLCEIGVFPLKWWRKEKDHRWWLGAYHHPPPPWGKDEPLPKWLENPDNISYPPQQVNSEGGIQCDESKKPLK